MDDFFFNARIGLYMQKNPMVEEWTLEEKPMRANVK